MRGELRWYGDCVRWYDGCVRWCVSVRVGVRFPVCEGERRVVGTCGNLHEEPNLHVPLAAKFLHRLCENLHAVREHSPR